MPYLAVEQSESRAIWALRQQESPSPFWFDWTRRASFCVAEERHVLTAASRSARQAATATVTSFTPQQSPSASADALHSALEDLQKEQLQSAKATPAGEAGPNQNVESEEASGGGTLSPRISFP